MGMNKQCRFFSFIVMLVWAFGIYAETMVPLDEIVAVVNNEVILKSTLLKKLNETKQPALQNQQQILEQLILNTIERQQAKELGIEVTDDMLNRALSMVAEQNHLDVDGFRATLAQNGIDFAAFKEDLRTDILINELRRQKIGRQIQVSHQEVANFFNTQAPAEEAEYSLYHYFVPTRSAEEHKTNLKAFLLKTTPITLNNKKLSELPTVFESVLLRLNPGEISEPIETSTGFHLLKLIEKKQYLTEQATRDQLKEELRKRKYFDELPNWLAEVRKQAYVDIRMK